MNINTPISLGELIDKISILVIKEKKIKDERKNNLIRAELTLLRKTLNKAISDKAISDNAINDYLNQLIEVNSALWKIEDEIRDCEKNKKFDQKFIDLARSVYITNDRRAEIKLEINNKFGSKIVEVKSYTKY